MKILDAQGHEVVAASPKTGVNTLTGEGVAEALTGAAVAERSLVPADGARIAGTRLDEWRTRASHGQ
ncbi:hypothetical protein [Micromonospora chalcea]|uniref:hypothetical protein n=1 Tax=Micromonospora chalcea TaxID=1874 RepID=UPI00332B39A9